MSPTSAGRAVRPKVAPEIVGIGASAGGLRALRAFFEALPPTPDAAFAVVVHLDPDRASELPAILQGWTPMPVVAAGERTRLEAGTVYVIPPNRTMSLDGPDIATAKFASPRGHRAPIDVLFRSIAEERGPGIAVVLSGSGSDGSVGVGAIREKSGLVLVQDPADAEFPSMPQAAISVGADIVASASELAARLPELIAARSSIDAGVTNPGAELVLRRILAQLRAASGHDFSQYKRPTVLRRIARRMQIARVPDLAAYVARMQEDPNEGKLLFKDLLISVTRFFRDENAFAALARDVIPQLFDGRAAGDPIRVWVPACASGEEAYSIAMLLFEEQDRRGDATRIQIFASDLDEDALSVARAGRYGAAATASVSEARLSRFFVSAEDGFAVGRELRDCVIFTKHDVLSDPPFARLDLVSCRNLLIYLGRELQGQVCSTFSYALRPGGVLFLGSSETVDLDSGQFEIVDREARLYRVVNPSRLALPPLMRAPSAPRPAEQAGAARARPAEAAGRHLRALEAAAPPSLLVDARHRIVHMSETAGRFLLHPAGAPTADAASLVRPELALDLRAALHRAFEHQATTLTLPVSVTLDGGPVSVVLSVRPAAGESGASAALVFFVEGGPAETSLADGASAGDPAAAAIRLRDELTATRNLLRAVREQYEDAADDLRASNEELQSLNEEYRAASEELETSKEELQSINEELQTVNGELTVRLDMVSRSNNDLLNLMAATEIATLFLDTELRIKRFTPKTKELFNLHRGDEGRPIVDFSRRLEYPELAGDARRVLETLTPIERAVDGAGGARFTTRLRPYRTTDDRIDGVVITFFDVTEKYRAEKAWATQQKFLLNELNHRAKNTLAVVQGLVNQSLRRPDVPQELTDDLTSRLRSLARSHELLLADDWKGAGLHQLVETQVAPHAPPQQVRVEGPPVVVPAECATPLGLVLNELATNAAKYGALSVPGGRVELTWRVDDGESAEALDIEWVERGGPPASEPTRRGMGLRLIESSVPRSTVRLAFDPQGFRMTMRMALRKRD